MALMLSELYDALLDIGVNPDKARKAAEAAAWPNRDIAEVRQDLAVLKTQMEHLNHRLTHVLTIAYLLLGGLVSTLWVLARH